jgi:DNA-binding transcriptional regulator GbsR (MarR family)
MSKALRVVDERVARAKKAMLEGVGREVSASFPGITRLGGQIVAALYLADEPLSMDALSVELHRSKSNVFANMRALEGAGIVERRRAAGARHDTYALRGKYPDVIVGAYLARLRFVVSDKQALTRHALVLLGDARGKDADGLRLRLETLAAKYGRFGTVFDELLPGVAGPIDLEALLDRVPIQVLRLLAKVAREALGLGRGNEGRVGIGRSLARFGRRRP